MILSLANRLQCLIEMICLRITLLKTATCYLPPGVLYNSLRVSLQLLRESNRQILESLEKAGSPCIVSSCCKDSQSLVAKDGFLLSQVANIERNIYKDILLFL